MNTDSKRICLNKGEECVLAFFEKIEYSCVSGNIQIAGYTLPNQKIFSLTRPPLIQSSICLSSLSSGVFSYKSCSKVEAIVRKSRIESISSLINITQEQSICILDDRINGNYAANLLSYLLSNSSAKVIFVDLNPENNCFAPGCISSYLFSPNEQIPMQNELLNFQFVFSCVINISPDNFSFYLNQIKQIQACIDWIRETLKKSNNHVHTIFKCPSLFNNDAITTLISILKPNLCVTFGNVSDYSSLQELLDRHQIRIVLHVLPHLLHSTYENKLYIDWYLKKYFIGPEKDSYLRLTSITFPLNDITIVSINTSNSQVEKIDYSTLIKGTIIAISYAESLKEVLFANIAGLAIYDYTNNNEMTLIVPATTPVLPGLFFIIPEHKFKIKIQSIKEFII